MSTTITLSTDGYGIWQWVTGSIPSRQPDWMSFGNYIVTPYNHLVTFKNATIPKNATILSAVPFYQAQGNYGAPLCKVNFYVAQLDNPTPPPDVPGFDAIPLSSPIPWDVPNFGTGFWYSAPDIKDLVQNIVNRPGWVSGNNIQLVCKDNGSANNGYRAAYAAAAVGIEITYTTDPPAPAVVPIFEDVIDKLQINETVSQLQIQYGMPTITLSSNRMQVTGHDLESVEAIILDSDFEILIGSK